MGLVAPNDFDGGDDHVGDYPVEFCRGGKVREGVCDGDYLGCREEEGGRDGMNEVVGFLAVLGGGAGDCVADIDVCAGYKDVFGGMVVFEARKGALSVRIC